MRLIKQTILQVAVAGLLITPILVSAATGPDIRHPLGSYGPGTGDQTTVNFCTRITNTQSDLLSMLTKAEDNRGMVRLNILGKLQDRKTQHAEQIKKNRDNAINNFEQVIANLEAKATTDAEKAAVETFKTTVETAITTRQTAVDAAVSAYQTALAALVGNREDVIKTAATTFKDAVTAAITTAQNACAGTNPDAAAIRTTFMASLKTANDAFRAAVQVKVQGQNNQQLEALAKTRNEAIKAANDAFKATLQSARDTLKAAFPDA